MIVKAKNCGDWCITPCFCSNSNKCISPLYYAEKDEKSEGFYSLLICKCQRIDGNEETSVCCTPCLGASTYKNVNFEHNIEWSLIHLCEIKVWNKYSLNKREETKGCFFPLYWIYNYKDSKDEKKNIDHNCFFPLGYMKSENGKIDSNFTLFFCYKGDEWLVSPVICCYNKKTTRKYISGRTGEEEFDKFILENKLRYVEDITYCSNFGNITFSSPPKQTMSLTDIENKFKASQDETNRSEI
jgi:hypothetical protein